MVPADANNLHLRSRRVVVEGNMVDAVVSLDPHDALRVVSVTPVTPGLQAGPGIRDLGDVPIVPAPLDLHFHGAGGHVVPPGGSVEAIDEALAEAAALTDWHDDSWPAPAYEWVATLPIPGMDRAGDVVDAVAREVAAASRAITRARETVGTRCVGLRIEGLFLNPRRAGVWPPGAFVPPSAPALDRIARAAAEAGTPLLVVDVAPETGPDGSAHEFIARARELGIVVSLAHTEADWDQAHAAIEAGATLATHTWNAMRATTHRDPGVVAAVLADPRVTCELICDGVHLHRGTIALSTVACGPGGWAVVSDASPFAGCAAGTYEWAGTTVHHDGSALRDHAGRLAGSASLAWAARRVLHDAGVSGLDAALALGGVPRRVLDPERGLGLVAGDPAWIVDVGPDSFDAPATR